MGSAGKEGPGAGLGFRDTGLFLRVWGNHGIGKCSLARLHIRVPELTPSNTCPSASTDPAVFAFAAKTGKDVC